MTGIDVSPGAVAVSRDRGVETVYECGVADVADEFSLGTCQAVLMLGNNFGLVGTADRAPDVLDAIATVTTDDVRIVTESRDVYENADDYHRECHAYNDHRGRLPGALRIRARYETHTTDWFDYLLVSPAEMDEILAETVWTRTETWHGPEGQYAAQIEKA